MPEAALQPFVTCQRQTGVAGEAATAGLAQVWTWRTDANAQIEAGPTTTSATKPSRRPFNQQNKLGSYHCWNRVYEPNTGRWTTPDPAMTPWSNLVDYTQQDPIGSADPTGLAAVVIVAGVALTAAEVILILGAVATAICFAQGTCAELIEEAWRKARRAATETSSSGGCSSGGATTAGGGSVPTWAHPGILAAIGAAAAAETVTRIGAAAAIKACEALHDSYKSYKCTSCDWRMSAAECVANMNCWTNQFTLRHLWIDMGCDYITPRSIKQGSAGQEDGHIAYAIRVLDEIANCASYVAAWGSVAK